MDVQNPSGCASTVALKRLSAGLLDLDHVSLLQKEHLDPRAQWSMSTLLGTCPGNKESQVHAPTRDL